MRLSVNAYIQSSVIRVDARPTWTSTRLPPLLMQRCGVLLLDVTNSSQECPATVVTAFAINVSLKTMIDIVPCAHSILRREYACAPRTDQGALSG